jgi:hypothetical protein
MEPLTVVEGERDASVAARVLRVPRVHVDASQVELLICHTAPDV